VSYMFVRLVNTMRIDTNADPSPTAPAKESLAEAAAKKPGIGITSENSEAIKQAGDDFEKSMAELHAKEIPEPSPETKTESSEQPAKKPGMMKKLLMALGGALIVIFGLKFLFGKKK